MAWHSGGTALQRPVSKHSSSLAPTRSEPSSQENLQTDWYLKAPKGWEQLTWALFGGRRSWHCKAWQTGAGAVHCPESAHCTSSAPLSTKPSAQWKLQLALYGNAPSDGGQSMLPWSGLSSGLHMTASQVGRGAVHWPEPLQ